MCYSKHFPQVSVHPSGRGHAGHQQSLSKENLENLVLKLAQFNSLCMNLMCAVRPVHDTRPQDTWKFGSVASEGALLGVESGVSSLAAARLCR
jgi:hypothetical protein